MIVVLKEFIREGCLQKIDRKGPQPRMFFLVSHGHCFLLDCEHFMSSSENHKKKREKERKLGKVVKC